MKDKKNIILLIVAIVFVILAIYYVYDVYKTNKEPKTIYSNNNVTQKTNYNNFKVYDKENKEVVLENYKDKPVVILFWQTSNSKSVELLKNINSKYEQYKDKIIFLPISMTDGKTESVGSVENFLAASEISIPVYYDLDKDAASIYTITEAPTFVFIKKDNTVLNKKEGTISEDALLASLDILAENY